MAWYCSTTTSTLVMCHGVFFVTRKGQWPPLKRGRYQSSEKSFVEISNEFHEIYDFRYGARIYNIVRNFRSNLNKHSRLHYNKR